MAETSIKIPSINQSYYTKVSAKANQDKIKNEIRPKYSSVINNISGISNVPKELIESFIFIESGGKANAQSPYAVGLMQLSPATASDTLVKEKGLGRLSAPETELLKKYLGSRYALIEGVKPKQTSLGKTYITKNDLFIPELNILIGAILLKQLMDEFTEPNGKIRMDKVIVIYNGGRYGKIAKKVIESKEGIEQIIKIVPKETSSYILKLLGTEGILDTMV